MKSKQTTPAATFNTRTNQLLFLLEAQLFHGLTKNEALMLWNDDIITLHDSVEGSYVNRY